MTNFVNFARNFGVLGRRHSADNNLLDRVGSYPVTMKSEKFRVHVFEILHAQVYGAQTIRAPSRSSVTVPFVVEGPRNSPDISALVELPEGILHKELLEEVASEGWSYPLEDESED